MPNFGIDRMGGLYYEGEGFRGYGIWPHPVVSIARFLARGAEVSSLPAVTLLGEAVTVFREDSFDPVSRVRRGRFYQRTPNGINEWAVQPHRAFNEEVGFRKDHDGFFRKDMVSFNSRHLPRAEAAACDGVFLGSDPASTRWRIIDVERITTGEDLVTLKAASRLGVLPELELAGVALAERKALADAYDKAADAAYRLDPESVIDRCREAATAMIGWWLANTTGDPTERHHDLAAASRRLSEKKKLAGSAGSLIALLHARGKVVEQVRRAVAPPIEDDARVALECLGLVARELRLVG